MAQNRADEVRRERRKKPGQTVVSGIKLSMDESKLDKQPLSLSMGQGRH
jgi:hypothetical protein